MLRSALSVAIAAALTTSPAVIAKGRTKVPPPPPGQTTVAASHPKQRDIKRRELVITDANAEGVQEIHVGKATGTTLTFEVAVKDPGGVLLADTRGLFFQPQVFDRGLVLIPKDDISKNEPVTLNVTLVDGTVVVFKLFSVPNEVDAAVDVSLRLEKRAAPESPSALKEQLEAVRAELDECKAASASAGEGQIASLLAVQDLDKPQTWNTVDKRPIRKLDKQSRLLVQARAVYRLLDLSFLLLTVENRDPGKTWVLDKAELALAGGGESQDVKVRHVATEQPALAPGEVEKVVISFQTPQSTTEHSYTVSLFEKNGNRHVKLQDVSL